MYSSRNVPGNSSIFAPVKQYFQIMRMAFRYKGLAGMNILCNMLYVIFNMASLLVFIPFLSLLFKPETRVAPPDWDRMNLFEYVNAWYNHSMQMYIEANHPESALLFICISAAVLFVLKNFFRYLAMAFLASIRTNVVRDIRNGLYKKVTGLPLSYYSDERKGDLMARLSNDVQEIEFSIMSTLELLFREPLAVFISISILLYWSWELTLFSLLLLPIGALVISRIGKSLKRSSNQGQTRLGELLSNIEETLSGLKIIKAFTAEKMVRERFYNINEAYRRIMKKLYRKRDLASPMSETLGAMVMIVLVWYGGRIVLGNMHDPIPGENRLNGEIFLGFIIVFSQLLRPIQGIANAYANISKGIASVDRINVIMLAQNKITEVANPKKPDAFKDRIEYRNVSFKYDREYVLKKIRFVLEKGKTIALVGESGGGKSTIADLLPRFHDCSEGEILMDGLNIRELAIKEMRSLMGIVSQNSILFNETVHHNIAFGMPGASREAVVEAAKIANAHEFIRQLEEGYDTNIGDGGGKLSGGQQQRLCIARAVLQNPPILILDEATSALDTESEKWVQEALDKLMENRTTLVIAHRLSTIRNADEILVIRKGEIVERGKHRELIDKAGIYKKLYHLQSFG